MIPAAPQETVGEAEIEPAELLRMAAWFQPVDLSTELPHPLIKIYTVQNLNGQFLFIANFIQCLTTYFLPLGPITYSYHFI
jgi:hypothetical protein